MNDTHVKQSSQRRKNFHKMWFIILIGVAILIMGYYFWCLISPHSGWLSRYLFVLSCKDRSAVSFVDSEHDSSIVDLSGNVATIDSIANNLSQDQSFIARIIASVGVGGKGEKGDRGEDGLAGTDGWNGSDVDTVGTRGANGDHGKRGKEGDDGTNGTNGIDGAIGGDRQILALTGNNISISNGNAVDLAPIVTGLEPWFGTDDNVGATLNTEDIYTLGQKVGIGTATPSRVLDIVVDADDGADGYIGLQVARDSIFGGGIHFQRSRGTNVAPVSLVANDKISYMSFSGYDGTDFKSAATFSIYADDVINAGGMPGAFSFDVYDNTGVRRDALNIRSNGNVGIGDTSPDGTLKLDVEGQIGATEYCDQDGLNCVPAGHAGANSIDELTDAISDEVSTVFLGTGAGTNNTGTNNTAVGINTLYANTTGVNNSAQGYVSLYANTTGANNSAQGYASLYSNTTGNNNSAQGAYAFHYNATGNGNSAQGYSSLYSNTIGSSNSAQGAYALQHNTIGNDNSAQGYVSLYANTTGANNSAQGYASLYDNTIGSSNSAQGAYALGLNATGNGNSAQGVNAGRYIADGTTSNTTGDFNVFLGSNTKALADDDQNEVVIGYGTTGIGSNSVTLGNDNIVTTALKGNVGIGTTSPSEKLHVIGNILATGTITPSDEKFKEDIVTIDSALGKISRISGKTYDFKTQEYEEFGFDEGKQYGVIAQEVEEVFPDLVKTYDMDGSEYKAVNYTGLIPVMIEAIKELSRGGAVAPDDGVIKGLFKEIKNIWASIAELIERVRVLEEKEKTNVPLVGTATLAKNETRVVISTEGIKDNDNTKIFVTSRTLAKDMPILTVTHSEDGSFTVEIIEAFDQDIIFNWWAVLSNEVLIEKENSESGDVALEQEAIDPLVYDAKVFMAKADSKLTSDEKKLLKEKIDALVHILEDKNVAPEALISAKSELAFMMQQINNQLYAETEVKEI